MSVGTGRANRFPSLTPLTPSLMGGLWTPEPPEAGGMRSVCLSGGKVGLAELVPQPPHRLCPSLTLEPMACSPGIQGSGTTMPQTWAGWGRAWGWAVGLLGQGSLLPECCCSQRS